MPADLGCYKSEYNAFGVFGREIQSTWIVTIVMYDVWYTVWYGMV